MDHFMGVCKNWLGIKSQVALVVKNPPTNAGDVRDAGLIPGSGSFPGGGNGNPIQYSCLENPLDRGAWQVTVCVVAILFLEIILFGTHFHCGYLLWKCLCTAPSPTWEPFDDLMDTECFLQDAFTSRVN